MNGKLVCIGAKLYFGKGLGEIEIGWVFQAANVVQEIWSFKMLKYK